MASSRRGAGIAGSLASKGVFARLCDLVPESLLEAKKRCEKAKD